jgi:uncharacterized protein YlxW (UPF0749 family)
VIANRLRTIPSWQVTLGVALLALGFLIAAQLSAEGPRIRYTTQERSPLVETANGLQLQQDALKDDIVRLRKQIQDLEAAGQGSAALVVELNRRLEEARIAAGLIPLTGTGIVLQLEDSTLPLPPDGHEADYLVSARDIRTVVEELWLAGAEAVSVNGERVTTSTAVLDIGGSILVNSAYLAPPFQVSAIGPTDLYDRLLESQGFRDFIDTRRGTFGLGVSVAEPERVDVPQFAGTINLVHGRPADQASGEASPSPALPGP